MLKRFHIQNFKSLVDFSLDDMGQFVCLTGLNGAGKTSVLQAIDFIAHLAAGGLNEWFKEREWNKSDIRSKLTSKRNIFFDIVLGFEDKTFRWRGSYNPISGRCTTEEIFRDDLLDIWLDGGQLNFVGSGDQLNLNQFEYEGSFLSFFKVEDEEAFPIKRFFRGLRSLELLSPHRMRSKSRTADDIGLGGEKLAGYIHSLKPEQKQQLEKELAKFYPRLSAIDTNARRAGWAQLNLLENYDSTIAPYNVETEAKHINDGLLRVLTLVAQVQAQNQFLLFDEIENGINPELVGQLVNYLLNAKQQIMVTTHNPVILNFLPDERAKESVYFLYRTPRGETKAKRFFDIPEVAQKLEVLGPGEVFLDTSLTQLSEELGRE